ncbi:hypothetical protein JHD50_07090 [Sulfurimonas sp. MAG313]|nr:hypothetical protein [Sulfurimonas sp. MAG313]MDF1881071.1 hypothetical protein [Sulfurimonas sp. MAG313]
MSYLKTSVRIFKGVNEKIHNYIQNPVDNFNLTIFYKLQDNLLLLNFELMIVDENPKIGKLVTYITLIELSNENKEIIKNNLELFVKEIKFNTYLFNDFKVKIQENINKNLSDFKYVNLYFDIEYYNQINLPIKPYQYYESLYTNASSLVDIELSF